MDAVTANELAGVAWTCRSCGRINHEPWNCRGIYACVACSVNGPFEIVSSSGAALPTSQDLDSLREGRAILSGDIAAWITALRTAQVNPPAEIENALKEMEAWVAELERLLAAVERGRPGQDRAP